MKKSRDIMWDEHVQELIQFQQQHGHCEVPHDSDEYQDLSAWIRQVRSSYASWMNYDGDDDESELDLTEERITDLQNLGLELYLLEPVKRGKRRIKELIAYKRLYGHHYRGNTSGSADFPKLNAWLEKLRAAHHDKCGNEEIPILMDVQLSQLAKMGYDFNDLTQVDAPVARESHEEKWTNKVEELKEFKRIHGHFRVPSRKAEYASLYYWIYDNRRDYKKFRNGETRSSRITDDRLSQLKAIGFDLKTEGAAEVSWNRRVEELKEFKRIHGHFQVPKSKAEYASLYNWIGNCRIDFKKFMKGEKSSRITDDRLSQLKAIGFDLNTEGNTAAEASWNRHVEELKEFKRIHGHFRVPSRKAEYASLYCWIRDNRQDYKKFLKGEKSSRITDDRLSQLKAIGFDLKTAKVSWNRRVEELKEFKRIHGHFQVPKSKAEYASLYDWIGNCRIDYKKFMNGGKTRRSRTTHDRFLQLKAIGFDLLVEEGDKEPSRRRELENIGTPKASTRSRRIFSSSSELQAPVVTPQQQSDTIMHLERDQDDDEVTVVHDRSPHQQEGRTESNNHHASRIHQPQWQQRASTPTYSDGQNYGFDHGVDLTSNALRRSTHQQSAQKARHQVRSSPRNHHMSSRDYGNNAVRQAPQAPGHGHVHPKVLDISPVLDGLEAAVGSMMEEMKRMEQNRAFEGGRPNQFWLEIGDRDGIDFFSSS